MGGWVSCSTRGYPGEHNKRGLKRLVWQGGRAVQSADCTSLSAVQTPLKGFYFVLLDNLVWFSALLVSECFNETERAKNRCGANMARIRKSMTDYVLGFQGRVLKPFQVVPSSL